MVQAQCEGSQGGMDLQEGSCPEGGPLAPGLPRAEAAAACAGNRRGERSLSRAGWALSTACWGNGRNCRCRWPGFGESRVRPSCHTRRSVSGRQFCRLMGQGELGTSGSSLLLSDVHRTTFSPPFCQKLIPQRGGPRDG